MNTKILENYNTCVNRVPKELLDKLLGMVDYIGLPNIVNDELTIDGIKWGKFIFDTDSFHLNGDNLYFSTHIRFKMYPVFVKNKKSYHE